MEGKKFSTVEAISFAFREILEHIRLFFFVFLVGSGLIILFVGIIGLLNKGLILSLIDSPMFQTVQECIGSSCLTIVYESGRPLIGFIAEHMMPLLISGVLLALFFTGLDLGFKTIALNVYDKHNSTVETLWSRFNLAITACFAWLLYCLMAWVGFMLFVIPGFIVILRFGFFPFFIIDKGQGAVDSLKSSYELTRDHVWDIFAFWVVIKIIIYIGFLTYIGTLLTWPVATLAYAYVYRQLAPRM